jgi:adenylosuccinate lyase
MIGPDATVTLDFALARLVGVIDTLVVYPKTMQENLDRLHGLVFSQRVLLALTQAGMSREDAYRTVQRHAMDAWKGRGDFLDLLKSDPEVAQHLDHAALTGLFDMGYHTKHVDTVFTRLFGEA